MNQDILAALVTALTSIAESHKAVGALATKQLQMIEAQEVAKTKAKEEHEKEQAKIKAGFEELKGIIDAIPADVKESLKAVSIASPDPVKLWFCIVRTDGLPKISIAKKDDKFRIRLRNTESGAYIGETFIPLNSLNGALAKIAAGESLPPSQSVE